MTATIKKISNEIKTELFKFWMEINGSKRIKEHRFKYERLKTYRSNKKRPIKARYIQKMRTINFL